MRKEGNARNCYAVAVESILEEEYKIVEHISCEIPHISSLFLDHGGFISGEVTSRRHVM